MRTQRCPWSRRWWNCAKNLSGKAFRFGIFRIRIWSVETLPLPLFRNGNPPVPTIVGHRLAGRPCIADAVLQTEALVRSPRAARIARRKFNRIMVPDSGLRSFSPATDGDLATAFCGVDHTCT